MSNKTLLLSILSLLIGFTCAYLIFAKDPNAFVDLNQKNNIQPSRTTKDQQPISTDKFSNIKANTGTNTNAFSSRFDHIEYSISLLQQQIEEIEFRLDESESSATPVRTQTTNSLQKQQQAHYNQNSITIERLLKGGIDSAVAEDIVRRKNAVEIKRLELNDRATRENYMNTQQYYDELAKIENANINLRKELGDHQYDLYLFNSKQSNRIKIRSVMLGSAAEQAGLEKGDIILSYDNDRLFTWPELKQATAKGRLDEYTSINVSRNGEIFSYSVPRGTLGIQMGAARIAP